MMVFDLVLIEGAGMNELVLSYSYSRRYLDSMLRL